MDRLSSCYFCGAALDASLSEYPIVPAELHPDDDQQQTVVLCPTCRRKLGQVVETVVGAMDGQPDSDGGAESVGDADQRTTDANGAGRGDADDGDVGWVSAEDAVENDPSSPDSASSSEDATSNGPDERLLGSSNDADDGRVADEGSATRRRRENGSADSGAEGSSASTDQHAGGRSGSTADEGNYADGRSADVASDRSESTGTDEGTDDPTDGDPSLTRLEYNKVMRLLQNREFPVDRAEIKAVATSAYELSDAEFERIIDAAVEHDLIDERNGQLVQAD